MQKAGIDRAKFRIQHNHLIFEGVFLTDCTPWQLGLACLTHNFALPFEVLKGYEASTYIHDTQALNSLMAALVTGAASGRRFSTSNFLREIDMHLPAHVTARDRAMPADTVRFRSDVEEANKIFLCGWTAHPRDGKRHVTDRNLAKTRNLINQTTADWCERHNVSSCWTDDRLLALHTIDHPTWPNYP